ncbi:MAG: nitroreductase family protein [Thermomicrobiales bacterium]
MAPEVPSISAIEAIHTTRSMRKLQSKEIPDDVLRQILDAAIRAPSGSNQQTWSFLVVSDPELKRQIQQYYSAVADRYFDRGPTTVSDGSGEAVMTRVRSSARHLADHLHEAPVLVFACIRGERSFSLGASIYPAVQNLMVAARAFGVGSTLTTFHLSYEKEIKELLGIPDDVHTAALIPLGYPEGNWGEAKRRPVEESHVQRSMG